MKYAVIEFIFACYLVLICAIVARGAIIEAEDYDTGGEGVAYHDNDEENRGNTGTRINEGVDLWDAGEGDGPRIGSTIGGEWIQWTHNFENQGKYKIVLHIATPLTETHVKIDINGETQTKKVPVTSGYGDFIQLEFPLDTIVDPGEHTLRVTVLDNSFDLDKLEIDLINETPTIEPSAGAFQLFDYATYYGETGQEIQMAWDHVTNAAYYEVQLFNMERGVIVDLENPKTPGLSMIFKLPYSGHFVAQVRACNDDNDDLEKPCSEWSLSTNPEVATVDGTPRAWWLYGHVAEPEGVDFISNP